MKTVTIHLVFSKNDESVVLQTDGVPHTLIIEQLNMLVKSLAQQVVRDAETFIPADQLEQYLDARIRVDRKKLQDEL